MWPLDCILGSARLRSKAFVCKCHRVCIAGTFRRAIICQAKRAKSNSGAAKCRFRKSELPGSIILELVDVPRRQFSYVDPPSGRWVTFDLSGVPYLTLWSDGGPILCVEPCWGLTDHHEQRAFEDKQGVQAIAASGELRASFSIAPQLASCD